MCSANSRAAASRLRRGRSDPGEVDAPVADVIGVLQEFGRGERRGGGGRNAANIGGNERPEVFGDPRFGLGGVEIANDGDGDLVGSVVLCEEGADRIEGNGAEVFDGAEHIVVVGVAGREEVLVKERIDAVVGLVFELLAALIDDDFALVIEVFLGEVLEKEGKGVGLHPQVALQAAGRDGGTKFSEVFVEIAAGVGSAEKLEGGGDRVAFAVFVEEMLDEVGEADTGRAFRVWSRREYGY